MRYKHNRLALCIAIALAASGCASNVSSGKYVDNKIVNATAKNDTEVNVLYEQQPIVLEDVKLYPAGGEDNNSIQNPSLLASASAAGNIPLPETTPEEIATVIKSREIAKTPQKKVTRSSVRPKDFKLSSSSKPKQDNVVANVNATDPDSAVEPTVIPEKTLTIEEKIAALTISPFEYQVTPELDYLVVDKNTDRVWLSVDEVKAKEYLLAQELSKQSQSESQSESESEDEPQPEPEKPIARLHFKVKKGSLKSNLTALLSATVKTELVYSASLNHYFYNDFEIEGDSILEIVDRIIDPFKTPHQVVAMPYVNNILRTYTKNK